MPDSTASQSGENPKTHLMLGRIFTIAEMLLMKSPPDEAEQLIASEEMSYQGTDVPIENHTPKKSMYSPISR